MFEKFEKIRRSGLKFLDTMDISIILGLEKSSSLVIATRMVKKGILIRLKRNLYLLNGADVSDLEIANRLITPSYISFESALNYWGLTTQIPETITSAARRSRSIVISGKEFQFSRLPAQLFNFGIVKEKNCFLARREKAFLDTVYYADLGRKSATFDEFDLGKMDKKVFNSYLKRYPKGTQKLALGLL